MRIGVDATCWTNRRGYGRVARALLTAALDIDRRSHYVFFTDDSSPEFPFPIGAEVVPVRARVPTVRAAGADGYRSPRDMWAMSRAISSTPLDLIFFPSIYSYVPLTTRAPKIVTIHDVIPELYPELVFPSARAKLFWRAKVRVGCAQARVILTVSDYSRECLAQELHISPERIRVVQEAGDPVFRRLDGCEGAELLARLGIQPGSRYLVYLGGFSPHKNIALLVELIRELAADGQFGDVRLVLVGDHEKDVFFSSYQQIKNQVEHAGLQDRVIFSGYLADEDVARLLNRATALLLPSFCEGVGLPALEAAACGTPAVVTSHSPLRQLLGEGVIALEPDDRPAWRAAVTRILTEPALRLSMSEAALAAAARLSWRASARQLLSVFEEVAGARVATA